MPDFKFCISSQDGVSLITELINSEMKNISEFGDGKGKILLNSEMKKQAYNSHIPESTLLGNTLYVPMYNI